MCIPIEIDDALLIEEMRRSRGLLETFGSHGLREASLLLEISLTPNEDKWAPTHEYWRALVLEIHILLCTEDPKYGDLRPDIVKISNNKLGRSMLIAIAGAVAATLGLGAAMILPFVALALYSICKIGLNAWCAANHADLVAKLESVELEDAQ